ncbi:MAG: heme lyase CcmF/NrfE family subunit [Alphaproteobacteria bacterium]
MIASFGELFVWLAWVISAIAAVIGYRSIKIKNRLALLWIFTTTGFGLIILGFLSLLYVFLINDFSVWLVLKNSHQNLAWYYRLAAAWGNHEGSLLLWVLVLAILAVLLLWMARGLPQRFNHYHIIARAVACQHTIIFLFVGYLLFTSNPFLRVDGAIKSDGFDLNPLLQDPGLIFHPPFLYGGFVGLSGIFSLAVGIMLSHIIDKKKATIIDADIFRLWQFFIFLAFVFLTGGIVSGSFWAYYELGWGGFWFWDPVENISLIPWLLLVALLHGMMVFKKTGRLKMSCFLLSLLSFSTSLVGTFLVRSGLITSVHSFANDPSRGIAMLVIIAILMGGGFFIWLKFYEKQFPPNGKLTLFSRNGLLVINNMIFYIITAIIFIGLIYPLALLVINNQQITVGAPFFNITTIPFFILLAVLLGLGFFLPNNDHSNKKNILLAWQKIKPLLILAVVGGGLFAIFFVNKFFIIWAGFGLVFLLLLVSIKDGIAKRKIINMASPFAHAGFAMIIMGVIGATQLDQQQNFIVKEKTTFQFHNINFKVEKISFLTQKHFNSLQVILKGNNITLIPEKRIYLVGGQETTEVAIHSNFFVNYYAAIGDIDQENEKLMIRFYYQPLVMFIFLGGGMMVLAGLLAILNHRERKYKKA